MNRCLLRSLLTAICLACGSWSFAQEPAPSTEAVDPMDAVTPEREAAALTFARRHHPELADILEPLKSMDRKGYDKAIQELFRTSEQLTKLQARTPSRYESELALWKIDSRIRLLVARAAKGDRDKLRKEVKKLLLDRNDIRMEEYVKEKERLEARISKIDASIDNLKKNGNALADKEIDRLLKSVEPASKKPSTKNSTTTSVKSSATGDKNKTD